MLRLAFALAAILLLLLSTSFTSNSFGPNRSAANAMGLAGGRAQLIRAGEIDLALGGPAAARPSAPAAPGEQLAPVLLVYLGLVLVGSVVAIGVVRINARREG